MEAPVLCSVSLSAFLIHLHNFRSLCKRLIAEIKLFISICLFISGIDICLVNLIVCRFPTIYFHGLSLISYITAKLYLSLDNSISVLAKHDSFRRQKQETYLLPIIVSDNGEPPMSSTNTLTIRVCGCSREGTVQSCNVEAFVLPIGLSMGALIAILACIILLLGRSFQLPLLVLTYFLI